MGHGWVLCPGQEIKSVLRSLLSLGVQLSDILLLQSEQVEDIDQALPVNTGRCLKLHLGLCAPGNTKAGLVEHEEVVGSVADGDCLAKRDVVLRSDGLEQSALLGSIDDGLALDQFAGQCLSLGIDFELKFC